MEDISQLFRNENKGKKVLLFAREPTGYGNLFREYGDKVIKNHLKVDSYEILSDYPLKTDFYIDLNKYTKTDFTAEDYVFFESVLDFEAIIKNDRFFRIHIPYLEALNYILNCSKFLLEFFRANKYDILVTNMPDCYVVDLLTQIARHFGVSVVSFCGSSFGKAHCRITERGEVNNVRDISTEEIDDFIAGIQSKSVQPYVSSKKQVYQKVAKYYFTYKLKYLWHYLIQFKLLNNKNYRYLMTVVDTYPRNLLDIIGVSSLFTKNVESFKELDNKKIVYIPLHYHPESTTEYWVPRENYLSYYPSLFKTISNYSKRGYTVLVKEHTASYLRRERKVYKDILAFKNTYLISPFVSTFEMFDIAEYIVVWTGTTGVEAIMADKKVVLAESEVYYSRGLLPFVGDEAKARSLTRKEKEEVARVCLESIVTIK
ncbi:hypothetical protein [uncultured Arcticibacterium sp.]|mgnify:CR=1 FL=1|uniref:hypothetical protein n=1 Tax=uncultured Arcticibacterium sp. TaxID=2173042 RepID=UPI0030FA0476